VRPRERRLAALACLATVGVADYLIRRNPPWLVVGLLDHPAHVATALLLREKPNASYLAGSLLPDLDHIPLALRTVNREPEDPRPVTHTLLTVPPVAVKNRDLAAGMLAHYLRDVAVGTGVPLLWPLSSRHLKAPYVAYAVILLAAAYSRSRPSGAAPAHIPGASGRGP
jgi:hypothetical protein